MLNGNHADVVELILHESAHATLYIESAADFNEQLATFLGQEAARRFFLDHEGKDSENIKYLELEQADQMIFSKFLKAEIDQLKNWYADQKTKPSEEDRQDEHALPDAENGRRQHRLYHGKLSLFYPHRLLPAH